MFNLATMLDDSARTVPARDAVVCGGTRLTYAEVDAGACQVANLLGSRGIRAGDAVALTCPNLPFFPIVYYGILKAGCVVVPLNVLFKAREIAYHLADSQAVAYFCFEGPPDLPMGKTGREGFDRVDGCAHFFLIEASPSGTATVDGSDTFAAAVAGMDTTFATHQSEPGDSAVILYTSGTTGQPKGAELSHANLGLNALNQHRIFQLDPLRPDTHLVTLPLFHSFGQTVQLNSGFGIGSTLVLLPRFDAATALDLMVSEGVTFFAGVPTMYWGLLTALEQHQVDVDAIAGSLRTSVAGGASLPVEILNRFKDRFHVQILEGYGLSETSPVATFNHLGRPPRPGSIGTPIWGVELRLIEDDWTVVEGADRVGEIAIRGHNVMKGYHGKPDETAWAIRDGWFRTGDLARRDEDGYYYIVDRAKDMILRGGFNVYPREVEEVLLTHPAVSLAAVVGIPDERLGEEVKAFVIRAEGARVTEDELVAWAREQMAAHKYPRVVEFRDALPMTATGKILKRELV